MTIIDALRDPSLLGALPAFRYLSTWRAWLVFLKAVYGLPLDAEELATFQKHTGRTAPREGGYAEAVAITGRQSGKSQVAALACAFEAATSRKAGAFALLVAQDERNVKRTLFRYAAEPFRSVPAFRSEVTRETSDALELASGVSLACYPCRPAAVRGVRACVVVVDELAFFFSGDARPQDREMLRAVRPCLATTGGRLLILSSPYGASGALWDLHRQHHGREESSTLVWTADAPSMNPTLPRDYVARMEADDPEAYRSEVLGEFRQGLSALFEPDALDACVEAGVRERAPQPKQQYVAFADSASGTGKDSFAVAVAHKDGERAVLDAVRAWKPPFNPSGVIAEAADLLKQYGVSTVSGDRYSPGFVAEHFRVHGIKYAFAEQDRSALYLEMLPHVNARCVVLLDLPELLREFRGLERRRGQSGRDRVDHRSGSHDDRANAAAGALVAVAARKRRLRGGVIDAPRSDDGRVPDAAYAALRAFTNRQLGYPSDGKLVVFRDLRNAWGESYSRTRDELTADEAETLLRRGSLKPADVEALRARGLDLISVEDKR